MNRCKCAPMRMGALVISVALLGGPAVAAGRTARPVATVQPRVVLGESQRIPGGASAYTWARLDSRGQVSEVGASVPAAMIWNPRFGNGPLGAFLSLKFPREAQETTYFNHFEAHWNPAGHPPMNYEVPHFDLHFYSIPESDVWKVNGPDSHAPTADALPPGYIYPGVNEAVPFMGVHAMDMHDMSQPFTMTTVAGFWHGQMTFLEPMVTREFLMRSPNHVLPVPRPRYLYRATQYPSVYRSFYNARLRAYEFTYSGFSPIQTGPVIAG